MSLSVLMPRSSFSLGWDFSRGLEVLGVGSFSGLVLVAEPTVEGIFSPDLVNIASSSGQDLVFSARVRFSSSSGRLSSGDMDSLDGPEGPKLGEEPRLMGDWLQESASALSVFSQREMLCRNCAVSRLCTFR